MFKHALHIDFDSVGGRRIPTSPSAQVVFITMSAPVHIFSGVLFRISVGISIYGTMASLADAFGDIGMEELDKKMTEDRLAAGKEPLGPFVNPLDRSRIAVLGVSLDLSMTELGDDRKHKSAAKMLEQPTS